MVRRNQTQGEPKDFNQRLFYFFLAACTLLALFPRFWQLDKFPIWEDETALWLRALGFDPWDFDPDLPAAVTYGFLWILQDPSPFLVRILPAFLSALSVIGIGLLASHLANRRAGIVAAALMAVSPFSIFFGREGRPYGFLFFFLPFLFLTFFRAIRDSNRKNWMCYALCVFFVTSTHFNAFQVVLALGITGSIANMWNHSWKKLLALIAATSIGCIPALITLFHRPPGALESVSTISFAKYFLIILEAMSPSLFSQSRFASIPATLTLALVITGFLILWNERRRFEALSLAGTFVLCLGITFAFVGARATWGLGFVRYVGSILIPIMLLSAIALERVASMHKHLLTPMLVSILGAILYVSPKWIPEWHMSMVEQTHLSAKEIAATPEIVGVVVPAGRYLANFGNYYQKDLPVYTYDKYTKRFLMTARLPSRGRLTTVLLGTQGPPQLPPGKYAMVRAPSYFTDSFTDCHVQTDRIEICSVSGF